MTTATNDPSTSESEPVVPIAYATSTHDRPPSRTGAGVALICGGLGLIVLGGCFLIGVLALVEMQAGARTGAPGIGLMWVLYLLAAGCFAGAAILILYGARGLLRILGGY